MNLEEKEHTFVCRPTDRSISDLLCLRFDNSWKFEHLALSHGAMESSRSESELAIQSEFGDVSLDADFRDITEHFPSSACMTCDNTANKSNGQGSFNEERHNSKVEDKVSGVFESTSPPLESSPDAIFFFELPDLLDPDDCCNGRCFQDTQPDFDELN